MEYDDIIVGAGSSGAVLASRLSEDPNRNILLLEAGPDYSTVELTPADLLNTLFSTGPHDWGLVAKATSTREIQYPRGKVTGGCSAVNGHIALRGTPQDFDEWAGWGNGEWSFEKVLPFRRKLEDDRDARGDFHGTGGPIWIERPRPEAWQPLNRAFFNAACAADDSEDMRRMVDGVRIAWQLMHDAHLGPMIKEFVNLTPEMVRSDSAL